MGREGAEYAAGRKARGVFFFELLQFGKFCRVNFFVGQNNTNGVFQISVCCPLDVFGGDGPDAATTILDRYPPCVRIVVTV